MTHDEVPEIVFQVSLFLNGADTARSRACVLILMRALCDVNETLLRAYPKIPDIYALGAAGKLRYEPENGTEEWQDILTTIKKGFGDCEDLACWRIAELRVRYGIHARPYIKWNDAHPNGRFHAVVELPDGRIEDPSAALGMGGRPIVARPVFISRT